jgi:hypothetical protein
VGGVSHLWFSKVNDVGYIVWVRTSDEERALEGRGQAPMVAHRLGSKGACKLAYEYQSGSARGKRIRWPAMNVRTFGVRVGHIEACSIIVRGRCSE